MMVLFVVEAIIVGLHFLVERVIAGRVLVNVSVVASLSHLFNAVYSVASLIGFVWWLRVAVRAFDSTNWLCGEVGEPSALFEAYFWSKLHEGVVDLTTCSLRFQINQHFRWHHYTTPMFAYLGWQSRSSHSFVFMGLNLWMHVMVYAHHAGIHSPFLKVCFVCFSFVFCGFGSLVWGALVAVGAAGERVCACCRCFVVACCVGAPLQHESGVDERRNPAVPVHVVLDIVSERADRRDRETERHREEKISIKNKRRFDFELSTIIRTNCVFHLISLDIAATFSSRALHYETVQHQYIKNIKKINQNLGQRVLW
jgi:hypothetical protein